MTSGATPAMPRLLIGAPIVAGDVRAVPVLVHVGGVGARVVGLVLARAVDERDVGREVAAQRPREVRRDVRMLAVHAGVDDPDQHVLAAPLLRVGAVGRRVDHLHVPLERCERLHPVAAAAAGLVGRRSRASGLSWHPSALASSPRRTSASAWKRNRSPGPVRRPRSQPRTLRCHGSSDWPTRPWRLRPACSRAGSRPPALTIAAFAAAAEAFGS